MNSTSREPVTAKIEICSDGDRNAHLIFESPTGGIVRSPMQNAHQPFYGDRYYARLKALERQMVREFDDLHIAILTFTGSSKNATGGWRCPADHLRDVISSWRRDENSGVYHALRYSMNRLGYEWEYAAAVEHQKRGYHHVHVAVCVDKCTTMGRNNLIQPDEVEFVDELAEKMVQGRDPNCVNSSIESK